MIVEDRSHGVCSNTEEWLECLNYFTTIFFLCTLEIVLSQVCSRVSLFKSCQPNVVTTNKESWEKNTEATYADRRRWPWSMTWPRWATWLSPYFPWKFLLDWSMKWFTTVFFGFKITSDSWVWTEGNSHWCSLFKQQDRPTTTCLIK